MFFIFTGQVCLTIIHIHTYGGCDDDSDKMLVVVMMIMTRWWWL